MLSLGIKYPMRDLIYSVNYCAWPRCCNMGQQSVNGLSVPLASVWFRKFWSSLQKHPLSGN